MNNLDSRNRLIYLLLFASLLLTFFAGCGYRFKITVIGDDPFEPTFVLKKPPLIEPLRKGVQLGTFWVYEKDSERKVWNIGLPSGSFKRVYEIHYGDVPPGFEEVKGSEPLAVNVKYRVAGFGAGCVGSTEFEIVREANVFKMVIPGD